MNAERTPEDGQAKHEPESPRRPPFPAVAIGGGAGAHEALHEVLRGLTTERLAIFVLQQNPGAAEAVADRLRGHVERTVTVASDGERVEPNTVYVVPHGQAPEQRDGG